MLRSVVFLSHLDYEGGGRANAAFVDVPVLRLPFPTELPPLDQVAGVVIFGGQMQATDVVEHPSLATTMRLALDAIDAEIPVLGLCLGHQLIAHALGAAHHASSHPESGRVALDIVEPDPWLGGYTGPLAPIEWHQDEVDVPDGATLVATGSDVTNQGFRYGSALGLQFHLEVDDPTLDVWAAEAGFAEEFTPAQWKKLRQDFVADATLEDVATRGFAAFAEACRTRL